MDKPEKAMTNLSKPRGMPTPVYDADAPEPTPPEKPPKPPKLPEKPREPHWIEPKKKGQQNLF